MHMCKISILIQEVMALITFPSIWCLVDMMVKNRPMNDVDFSVFIGAVLVHDFSPAWSL